MIGYPLTGLGNHWVPTKGDVLALLLQADPAAVSGCTSVTSAAVHLSSSVATYNSIQYHHPLLIPLQTAAAP